MNFVYFVKKDDLLPYMLVTVHDGGSEFRPMVAAADNAALTLNDQFSDRPIDKKELAKIVGKEFVVSGPVKLTRNGQIEVKDFLFSADIWTKGAGGYKTKSDALPYTSDIADMPIGSVGQLSDFNKVVAYKADAFLKEQHKSTFNYQVKKFKPVWDASIFWPETGRRGGWRCPPAAGENAGNFTNAFGRGCGFGVARRLANIVGGVGRALETQDDTRRAARAATRQGEQAAPSDRRQRRIERRNQRMIERLQAEEVETFGSLVPEAERDRRPLPIPEGAEVVPEEERTTELVPELGDEAASARRQAAERRRGAAIQEEVDRPLRPRRDEDFEQFMARSFDEYQKRGRRMRQRGEDVDDLDYDQWRARNEDRLRAVHEGAAERETRTQRARRQMSERRRRNEASDAVTRETSTRRPTADDEVVEIGIPSPERERTVLAPEPEEDVTERMTDLERAAVDARREREERVRAAREEAAPEPVVDDATTDVLPDDVTTDVLTDVEPEVTTAPDEVTEPPAPSPAPSPAPTPAAPPAPTTPRLSRSERREARLAEREERRKGERKRRAAEFRKREAERQARLQSGGYFARSRFFGPDSFFRIGPVLTGPTYDRDILGRQIPDALIPTRLRNQRDRMLAEQAREEAKIRREQERILQERERRERERARRNRERRERRTERERAEEERRTRAEERAAAAFEATTLATSKRERRKAKVELRDANRTVQNNIKTRLNERVDELKNESDRLKNEADILKNRRDDAKVRWTEAKNAARDETDTAAKARKKAEADALKAEYERLDREHKTAKARARAASVKLQAGKDARSQILDQLVFADTRSSLKGLDDEPTSVADAATDARFLGEMLRTASVAFQDEAYFHEATFNERVNEAIEREQAGARETDTEYQDALRALLPSDDEKDAYRSDLDALNDKRKASAERSRTLADARSKEVRDAAELAADPDRAEPDTDFEDADIVVEYRKPERNPRAGESGQPEWIQPTGPGFGMPRERFSRRNGTRQTDSSGNAWIWENRGDYSPDGKFRPSQWYPEEDYYARRSASPSGDSGSVSDVIDELEADMPAPEETSAERAARELTDEARKARAVLGASFTETGEIPDRPFWREDGYTGVDKDALESMFGILYEDGPSGRLLSSIDEEASAIPETDTTPESVDTGTSVPLTPSQMQERKDRVGDEVTRVESEFSRSTAEAILTVNRMIDNYEAEPRISTDVADRMAEAANRREREAYEESGRAYRALEDAVDSPVSTQEEVDRLLNEWKDAVGRYNTADRERQIADAQQRIAQQHAEDDRLAAEAGTLAPTPEPEASAPEERNVPEAPPIVRSPEEEVVFSQQEELELQIRAENVQLNIVSRKLEQARNEVADVTDAVMRLNAATVISPDIEKLQERLKAALEKLSLLASERSERLYKIRELEKVRGIAMREMPGDFIINMGDDLFMEQGADDLLRESYIGVMEVAADTRARVEDARIAAIEARKANRDAMEANEIARDEARVARARAAQRFLDELLPIIREEEDFDDEPLSERSRQALGEALGGLRDALRERRGGGDEEDGVIEFDDDVTGEPDGGERLPESDSFSLMPPQILESRDAIGSAPDDRALPTAPKAEKTSARYAQARRDYYEELNNAIGENNRNAEEQESSAVAPEPTPRAVEPEPRTETPATSEPAEIPAEPEPSAPTPDTGTPESEAPEPDTAVSAETEEPETPEAESEPAPAPQATGRRRGGGGRRTGASQQAGGRRGAAAQTQQGPPKMNRLADRRTPEMPSLSMTGRDTKGEFRKVPNGNAGISSLDDALKYEGSLADIPDKYLIDVLGERSFGASDYASILMEAGETEASAIEKAENLADAVIATVNGGELTDEARAALLEARKLGVPFFRYSTDTKGTGASLYFLIQEDGSIDGRGYIVKGPDADYGSAATHAEIVGADLARRWGFAYATPRLVRRDALQWKIENGQVVPVLDGNGDQKVTRNAAFMVGELAPNLAEGIVRNMKPTAGQRSAGVETRQDDVVDKESRLAAALLNAVLGGADRHPGNGMIFDGNGALPIDFGRSFTNMDNYDSVDKLARYITEPYGRDGERRLYGRIDSDPMAGWRAAYEAKIREGMAEADAQAEIREELRQFISGLADKFADMLRGSSSGNILGPEQSGTTPYRRITQSFNQGSDMSGYRGTADVTELHYREDKLRRAQRIIAGMNFVEKLLERVLAGPPSPPQRRRTS